MCSLSSKSQVSKHNLLTKSGLQSAVVKFYWNSTTLIYLHMSMTAFTLQGQSASESTLTLSGLQSLKYLLPDSFFL